ncbi:MAG: ABC transporter permease [Bacteroidales bacterium]|nr:ABC transporter permease [Bacteroidales bacterium]
MLKLIKRYFFDLKKYRHYISYSVKSSLKAELSNTILGYLWWLLDPLLHMLIYTFLVTIIFNRATQGFPVFVFCALLPWKVATTTMTKSTSSVRENGSIIKQIYIPTLLLSLITLLTNSVKLLFGLLVLFGMLYFFKIPFSWHIVEFIPTYLVFFFLYWGFAMVLTHLGVLFYDMRNLINYIIMFWFYSSPGMWSLDRFPQKYMNILRINPNVTFFTSFRNIFMYQKSPEYEWLAIWMFIAIIINVFGIMILYKSEKNYTKVI